MKKFLCLLVALALVGSIALAEVIDLSSMTDDDLLALKVRVEEEIKSRDSNNKVSSWYDYGLGQYFPSFVEVTGNSSTRQGISVNKDHMFAEQFTGATNDDFRKYCEALEEWGFNTDKQTSWVTYEASNAEGIKVHFYIINDQITLQARVPLKK